MDEIGEQADLKEIAMSEASQSKLLNDASDLRKSLGRAQDVLRGMQTERGVALTKLAKLRNEATAYQLKVDTVQEDCAKIEAQVAKLDSEIKGLSDMLSQFSSLGAKVGPSAPKPASPVTRIKTSGGVRIAPEDAEARRAAIIEACTVKPRTMPELRVAFPSIAALNLRPMISLMVKGGYLKMTGTVGSYLYSRGPKAGAVTAKPKVAAPTPVTTTAPSKDDAAKSLRSAVLKMVLAGPPRRSVDFYSVFPKARHHTIQSALSGLFAEGAIGRTKAKGNQFTYCAPTSKGDAKAPAASVAAPARPGQRGHADAVLALLAKQPLPFAKIAENLEGVNRHVLHQTVHSLVLAKRLRASGKRNAYVYATV